ncbi:helix-turn-helix domain-containing protein [Bacteroidales bacterium OttesenSCG-928-M11]|nr:helix-turn-helix domain-containing protein [Bacteroidales bacterium OttesenSCG-928-M11]
MNYLLMFANNFYINTISLCKEEKRNFLFPLTQKKQNEDNSISYIELILIKSGYIVSDCNFNTIRINSQDVHLSVSKQPSYIKEKSSDAEGWYCCFPSSFLSSMAGNEHLSTEIDLISSFLFQYPLRLNKETYHRLSNNLTFITQLFNKRGEIDLFLIYIYLSASIYEIKRMMQKSHLDFYPAQSFFIVKQYGELLSQNITKEHSITYYAEQLRISPNHLNKVVKTVTGKTAIQLLNEIRLELAREYLTNSELSISEVAYQLGFEDPSYFSRYFKKGTGISPSEWKTHNSY